MRSQDSRKKPRRRLQLKRMRGSHPQKLHCLVKQLRSSGNGRSQNQSTTQGNSSRTDQQWTENRTSEEKLGDCIFAVPCWTRFYAVNPSTGSDASEAHEHSHCAQGD